MKKTNIKTLCFCAMMAALYVGLDYLAVAFSAPFGGTIKLSVSGLPVILAAVLFGPLWGGAVGLVGAFLGQLITYGFTATTLLWCLPAVMGFLFRAFKRNLAPLPLGGCILISSLLVTAANTFVMWADSVIYRYPVVLVGIGLINRLIAAALTAILFTILTPLIVKLLKKTILK